MKFTSSDRGLSLIEVLISITILSILLLSVAGFFTQSEKASALNNEKTVATYLAQATMERLQKNLFTKSSPSLNHLPPDLKHAVEQPLNIEQTYSIDTCKAFNKSDTPFDCDSFYSQTINNKPYTMTILQHTGDEQEKNLGLIPIEVFVHYNGEKSSVGVEGYLKYEKTNE